MGSYPSADLLYGIDLGLTEDSDRPWFTEELEEEHEDSAEALAHLLRGTGVRCDVYGNACTNYTGLALSTRSVHASAYNAEPVVTDWLTDTVEDEMRLKKAWAVLYPDQTMPEPRWFIVVSYG